MRGARCWHHAGFLWCPCLRRRKNGGNFILQSDAQEADERIGGDGDVEGRAHGICPEEEESRQEGSEDCAQGIESVQERKMAPEIFRLAGYETRQRGERPSHQGRWNDEGKD